ncbi:MAG: SMC family ATPase [Chloroflexota bacterium]
MRIVSLELENVKSYVRERITFSDGLNAVCGLNGSGKTTILEAIGFALFDYLPYNQAAFVREGQKTATVRVRLVARNGREYEVVRRIGSGNPYYVVDVEHDRRLAERGPNVLDWIRTQALGMEGAADLSALFKNAVGVPQGLLTADFLQTSGTTRKSIFDPLLRVEEYRSAWEYLRETGSYLEALMGTVREDIARLENETEKIPALQERVADLSARVHAIELDRARLKADLDMVGARKDELDAREKLCQKVAEQLRGAQYDKTRFAEIMTERLNAVDLAKRAQEIVCHAETGYQIVVAVRQRLRALEGERAARDELNAQSGVATAKLSAINARIEGLQSQWHAARSAEAEAAELAGPALRQEELETAMREALQRLSERDSIDKESARLADAVKTTESEMRDRARRIHDSQLACQQVERLDDVRRELEEVRHALAQIEPWKAQQAEVRQEGQRLRGLFDTAAAEVERKEELERRLAERTLDAAPVDTLLARQQAVRDERTRVLATLDYQQVARGELHRHHCPLLDLTCPAVEADTTVLDRFDGRVDGLGERARALESELASLSPQLEAAQDAAEEVRRVQLEVARLEGSAERRDGLGAELERCRKQFGDLAALVADEEEHVRARDRLTAEYSDLQRMVSVAAVLPELEDRQAQDTARLDELCGETVRLASRLVELDAVEGQRRELERALQELGDVRRRRADLTAIASRLSEIDAEQKIQHELLGAQQDRLKAIVAQLQRYKDLESALAEERAKEEAFTQDHDQYLQHREEAGRLHERQTAVDTARNQLESADRAVEERTHELERAQADYDVHRHEEIKQQHRLLGEEISSKGAERKLLGSDLERSQHDLESLQRTRDRLLARRAEHHDLERLKRAVAFVRETLKEAGPVITETLLANISQTANDIYAEIMNDHAAELRWNRDYEVVVQRGAEERRFAQLSGGEQMSAALAVRLALLKEMSEIDFAFFDEPTQNMDGDRRTNLAEQIRAVRGFQQLMVISHDDTFEHHTDNLIRVRKEHEESKLEPV